MQVAAALATEIAAHFAHRADHFVPAVLRCQRPTLPGVGQRALRRGADGIIVGRHGRCTVMHDDAMQPMAGGVGHQQVAVRFDPQRRGPSKPLRRALAGQHARLAIGAELQDAARRKIGDIEMSVTRGRHRQRPRARRQRMRVRGAFAIDPAQRAIADVGDPDIAVAVQRERRRRVEAHNITRTIDETWRIATGNRAHAAIAVDHADAIVQVSATNTRPNKSTATPIGARNCACAPSPSRNPAMPVPASVVTSPCGHTLRIAWLPVSAT